MRKEIKNIVYGVGINDSDYSTYATKGKDRDPCPFMSRWQNLFRRVYSESVHQKQPTYIGCSVNVAWHKFSDFKVWMQDQPWQGMELDKDLILPGNKEYGPDTCAFVPNYVNTLFNTHNGRNKNLPLGVSYRKKSADMHNELNRPYNARVRIETNIKSLGMFSNPEEAHAMWQLGKIEAIRQILEKYSKEEVFDRRVFDGVYQRIITLQNDYAQGVITQCL